MKRNDGLRTFVGSLHRPDVQDATEPFSQCSGCGKRRVVTTRVERHATHRTRWTRCVCCGKTTTEVVL